MFSFIGVLLLSSALVTLLFQEARAVDIAYSTAPTSISGTGTFIVDVTIPSGESLPIQSVGVVLEKQAAGRTDKAGVTVVSNVICPISFTSAGNCPTNAPFTFVQGPAGIITQVSFQGFFSGTTGYAVASGYTRNCPCASTNPGYGYDTQTPLYAQGLGYGYGYNLGNAGAAVNIASGQGYGYGEGLKVRFAIDISTGTLAQGNYYLTFLVFTGSPITGTTLSSPATLFQVLSGGGGGSGGSGGGAGGSATVSTTVSGGTSTSTITGTSGQVASISLAGLGTGNPGIAFSTLSLNLAKDLQNGVVTVTASPTPTEGAPAPGPGFAPAIYLSISAPSGSISGGTFTFSLTSAALGSHDPAQVVVLHFKDNAWVPLATSVLSNANGVATFSAALDTFSPFAIAFDTQPPSIGAVAPPDGSDAPQRPLISAQVSDNRGINAQATTMTVDGQPVAATVASGSISYTPTVALTDGLHTVVVTATDLSGLKATKSWSFTSKAGACPGPTVTIDSPADGSATSNKLPTIRATFTAQSCSVDPATVTVQLDGAALTVAATSTGVTVTPTAPLADGVHTVRVTAADTSGNGNFATSKFTVDTVKPGIAGLSPAEGAVVGARPAITAQCADALSGVDASGVKLLLDGVQVAATFANGRVSYTPGTDLSDGKHTAQLTCTDKAGNSATQSWSFTTQGAGAGGFPWGILLVVVVLLVVVGGAGYWYLTKRKPPASPPK